MYWPPQMLGVQENHLFFRKIFYSFFVVVIFSEDFREFLKKDLIEVSSLIQLEQCGRLNWWAETGTCQRLWPIGKNLLSFGYLLISKIYPGLYRIGYRIETIILKLPPFLNFE